MRLQEAYFRLPISLQELALSAYGLRLRTLRYSGVHPQALANALDRLRWDAEAIREYADAQLFAMLRHAKECVPFYREQSTPTPAHPSEARAVLREWPLLTKAEVQQAGKHMLADGIDTRSMVHTNTGGTTGRALSIASSREALQLNYAFFERFKRTCGINARDAVATFAGRPIVSPAAEAGPYWRRNYASNQLLLSSYHIRPETLGEYSDALRAFAPSLIDTYPSSLEPIARYVQELDPAERVNPRAIITSSETLLAPVRETFERAFSCPVFDHYGSAEMVALITQCNHGTYHVNEDFGFMEILDEDGASSPEGGVGEIVATGYINPVMPLIRYRMGDLAVPRSSCCSCGLSFQSVSELVGRMDDTIITPEGRRVGRLDPIFKGVSGLYEARILQETIDAIRVELVCSEAFIEVEGAELLTQLRYRLGNSIGIVLVRVDQIPRTRSGKLRLVESKLPRAN